MEKEIKLIFPFKLNDTFHSASLKTIIILKESTISFSLPFNLNLKIVNAELKKHSKINQTYFYVFTFDELVYAKEFMHQPQMFVMKESVYRNREELEDETNKFLDEYESTKKKRVKQVLIEHEDGFCEFVTEEF
ncbi:hypothetical protein TUBRATIS_008780 [Tubulinosema ratisbonensis]|uniref:Uncharacterized protein n=1 Tax=Tubulinosema ratisbonensis TaxID=291195 RepID=A0A437AN02_9MICR|nr:hypothetical protein TUBRATIS_008780 [Tubulinosema ratisbonensis]